MASKKKRKLVGHLMISEIDKQIAKHSTKIKKLRENKKIVREVLRYNPQGRT